MATPIEVSGVHNLFFIEYLDKNKEFQTTGPGDLQGLF